MRVYFLSNKKSIRIRSAFDVLSKTSPDGKADIGNSLSPFAHERSHLATGVLLYEKSRLTTTNYP